MSSFGEARWSRLAERFQLLFVIGSNALFDAKAAATDPDLQGSLQHAATLFSMAGISIGKVLYEDVDRAVYEDDARRPRDDPGVSDAVRTWD